VRAHATLRQRGHDISERELRRALARLDLDESEAAAVEGLVSRLVGRLLAGPERTLREADDEAVAEVVLALFDEE